MTTATEDLDGECIHLITRRFCADCNGTAERFRRERDLEVERVLTLDGWFLGTYGGRCARCSTRYEPRTPVRKRNALDRIGTNPLSYIGMCCAPEAE